MTDKLFSKLQTLKDIKPDKKYAEVSRGMLLAKLQIPQPRRAWFLLKPLLKPEPRFNLFSILKYVVPATAVAGFLFMMLGGYSAARNAYFAFNFPGLMNEKALASEFNDFEIQIKIAEVQYYSNTSEVVSSALGEIISATNHMNDNLIQKEVGIIDESSPTNEKIDNALNDFLQ